MVIKEKLINDVRISIDKYFEEIVTLRRNFHMHPELSEHEKFTSDLICEYLSKLNIPYQRSKQTFAVVGYIEGCIASKKTIGIRADIDALPIEEATNLPFSSLNKGVMHACGHDMHTAILLGTAKILSEMKDSFAGTVKFFFQPAEETCGGAKRMIEEGCLNNPKVDYVIGLHIEPEIKAGQISLTQGSMNAASTEFYVKINGKSCHAAHPNKGIDPLSIACEIILAYQNIPTKKMAPSKKGLITVGQFNCGAKNNIISEQASFSGIIRAHSLSDRDFIKDELSKLTNGISKTYGASALIEFEDSYPNLINDQSLYEKVKELGIATLGKDNIIINSEVSMGADDFSYFTHATKSFYFDIGTSAINEIETYPLHNKYLNPDEDAIKIGMLMEVLTTLELLNKEY